VEYYNYSTELPFSKKKIKFREFTTKEQIVLAKANLSFANTKENYFDYNDFIIKTIKNCLENKNDFDNINIMDYILFLTKLRIISIGSTIEFVTESNHKEAKTTKITLDLNIFLKNLYFGAINSLSEPIISENNVEIKLNWPNINSIELFQSLINEKKSDYEKFSNSFQEFIEYVKINDKKIIFLNFSTEEKTKIVEKISVSLLKKVQNTISESLSKLAQCDLFNLSAFKDYIFNFYHLTFIDFIRLFFSGDIRSIYQELYFLGGESLSQEYILNISPAERKIYSSIINEARKKKSGGDSSERVAEISNKYSGSASKEIQDLALEFGQTPP
jgi:hypothetical protein